MEQTAREAYNAYMRDWKKRNREKVKVYNQNYWAKRAKENKSSIC